MIHAEQDFICVVNINDSQQFCNYFLLSFWLADFSRFDFLELHSSHSITSLRGVFVTSLRGVFVTSLRVVFNGLCKGGQTRSNFATQSRRATLAVQPLHAMVRHCVACVAGFHAIVARKSCSESVRLYTPQ